MPLASLVALHEVNDPVRHNIEVVVDSEHEGSVVCDVELQFMGQVEVSSI